MSDDKLVESIEESIRNLSDSMTEETTSYESDLRAFARALIDHTDAVLHRAISGRPIGFKIILHDPGADIAGVITEFRKHSGVGARTAKQLIQNISLPVAVAWGLESGKANAIAESLRGYGANVEVMGPR